MERSLSPAGLVSVVVFPALAFGLLGEREAPGGRRAGGAVKRPGAPGD